MVFASYSDLLFVHFDFLLGCSFSLMLYNSVPMLLIQGLKGKALTAPPERFEGTLALINFLNSTY